MPKTVNDDIYKRIKLYEDAYREKMVERSVRDRYKVIGNNIRMTASVDTADARFFRDPYSGKVYAEVWLRLEKLEDKEENRTDWQQPIPESWGEYLFVQVRMLMTGE